MNFLPYILSTGIPDSLSEPLDDVCTKITERIDLGEEFLRRPPRTTEELERLRSESLSWSEYNKDLLEHIFTNMKFSIYYGDSRLPGCSSNPRVSSLKVLRDSIDEKNRKLRSIKDRAALLDQFTVVPPRAPVNLIPSSTSERPTDKWKYSSPFYWLFIFLRAILRVVISFGRKELLLRTCLIITCGIWVGIRTRNYAEPKFRDPTAILMAIAATGLTVTTIGQCWVVKR